MSEFIDKIKKWFGKPPVLQMADERVLGMEKPAPLANHPPDKPKPPENRLLKNGMQLPQPIMPEVAKGPPQPKPTTVVHIAYFEDNYWQISIDGSNPRKCEVSFLKDRLVNYVDEEQITTVGTMMRSTQATLTALDALIKGLAPIITSQKEISESCSCSEQQPPQDSREEENP